MPPSFKLFPVRKRDTLTSSWSGGSTTEFFIYPAGALYADRDFLFRISSATVNTDTSVFTSLPDYNRILLLLDGNLRLIHEEYTGNTVRVHHESKLMPLEQDFFDGGYKTTSLGMGCDFNLMMRKELHGKMEVLALQKEEKVTLQANWVNFVYLISGGALVCLNKQNQYIIKDEMAVILSDSGIDHKAFTVAADSDSIVIIGAIDTVVM